jgi:hypothetical protein
VPKSSFLLFFVSAKCQRFRSAAAGFDWSFRALMPELLSALLVAGRRAHVDEILSR